MPETEALLTFVAAALLLLVLPGPGVLYVVTRSLEHGRRAGMASAAGLSAGAMVHALAATAGLSAVLSASASAFAVVKALGAGYLIYLGLRTILTKPGPAGAAATSNRTQRRLFSDGVVVSVLNPKIALFFIAFFPQFVNPARGSVSLQILVLGTLYSLMALVTDGTYALLASGLGRRFRGRWAGSAVPRYVSGSVYIGLGVSAALADRRR